MDFLLGTQEWVRNSHDKQAISVRATEVLLQPEFQVEDFSMKSPRQLLSVNLNGYSLRGNNQYLFCSSHQWWAHKRKNCLLLEQIPSFKSRPFFWKASSYGEANRVTNSVHLYKNHGNDGDASICLKTYHISSVIRRKKLLLLVGNLTKHSIFCTESLWIFACQFLILVFNFGISLHRSISS